MGKSKHIKDSEMISFFFNVFACSETDGEWKAVREISCMKGERKCNMLKDLIWAKYD